MRGFPESQPPPPLPAHETTPPPGESGYVDLFSDMGPGADEPQKPADDPFLAAARASLPETYGNGTPGAPDPFAGLRDDISAMSAPEPPHRRGKSPVRELTWQQERCSCRKHVSPGAAMLAC